MLVAAVIPSSLGLSYIEITLYSVYIFVDADATFFQAYFSHGMPAGKS